MKCNRPLSALRFTSGECHYRQSLNSCYGQYLRFFLNMVTKPENYWCIIKKNPSSSHQIPQIETSSGGTTGTEKSNGF